MRNISTAMMISMIDMALATYADKNGGASDTQTTTVSGGVNTSGDASSTGTIVSPSVTTGSTPTNAEQATTDSLNKIGSVGAQLLAKTLALPPTITVDQGTSVKVYVQKDLFFPGRSANLTKVVE